MRLSGPESVAAARISPSSSSCAPGSAIGWRVGRRGPGPLDHLIRGVDADAAGDPRGEHPQQRPVAAADVEHARLQEQHGLEALAVDAREPEHDEPADLRDGGIGG